MRCRSLEIRSCKLFFQHCYGYIITGVATTIRLEAHSSQIAEGRPPWHICSRPVVSASKTLAGYDASTDRFVFDSVTGVSIFRIYFTIIIDFRDPDFLWPASQATKWTLVEVNIAIVCGTAVTSPSPYHPFHAYH